MLLGYLAIVLWGICLGQELQNWPTAAYDSQVSIRAQRDVLYSVPIDQDTVFGVSLTTVFEQNGYEEGSMSYLSSLLGKARLISLDLYYNNFTSMWQLCPAPFPVNGSLTDAYSTQKIRWNNKSYNCQASFSPYSVMNSLNEYILLTNDNMNVNYIQVLYRLHQFDFPKYSNKSADLNKIYKSSSSVYNQLGNKTLADTVLILDSHLFSVSDLNTFRQLHIQDGSFYNQSDETFPSLNTFIYSDLKRTTVSIVYDNVTSDSKLYNLTSTDKQQIFVNGTNVNISGISLATDPKAVDCINYYNIFSSVPDTRELEQEALTSHFRYIYDSDEVTFTNHTFAAMVRCGLSPVLNATKYKINDTETSSIGDIIDYFLPDSYWSWSPNGGSEIDTSYNKTDIEEDTREAFKCVIVDKKGWKVANCYDTYRYACKSDPLEWHISSESKLYFDIFQGPNCPDGYSVSYPGLSLEMLALMKAIEDSETEFPVWIDVNDITVSDCFVTGGPYAVCPYQRTVSTKALAGLIAPSFVVAVVVLVLLFLEKVFRVNPIQTNRKRYWKKKINEYNKKNDYEGVPS